MPRLLWGRFPAALRVEGKARPQRGVGCVACSINASQRIACARLSPHMAGLGRSEAHTAGRSGRPKMQQRASSSSCTQRMPAGLPCGMLGMGEEIDGAVQQAPQPGRQSMALFNS